jgi:DNA-binding Lrp family transcriptional regulator
MRAVALLKITSINVQETYRLLKQLAPVRSSCLAFGRYDALAIIEAENLEAMRRIAIDNIQTLPGVIETLLCLIVEDGEPVDLSSASTAIPME